jgi:hypothetical protein
MVKHEESPEEALHNIPPHNVELGEKDDDNGCHN